MADWTDIPDSRLEPGKPGRTIDIIAIRDNLIAALAGAPGAPRVQNAALDEIFPVKFKSATQSTSSNSFANVTDLLFPVAANEAWAVDGILQIRFTGTGSKQMEVAINGPASPSSVDFAAHTYSDDEELRFGYVMSYNTGIPVAPGGSVTAPRDFLMRFNGIISNGSNAGNIQLRFRSNQSNQVAIRRGYIMPRRLP